MDKNLNQIKAEIYDRCALEIFNFRVELESKEYGACRFELNGRTIISRNAKITPKKNGQFVTFWKRNGDGPIAPFSETDSFDFYIVNVRAENKFGQFVFPKSILAEKGIISTIEKEGKRGFRVYPDWDSATSKQAIRTQKWQLDYFYTINNSVNLTEVSKLYKEVV